MMTNAREFAQRLRQLAGGGAEEIHCILCGAPVYASERSLQVQCHSCGHYVHVRDIRIAGSHGTPRTITSAKIIVESRGRVTGDLIASSVEIHGEVAGNVLATQEVRLGATARVAGHVLCGRLQVVPGAFIEGSIERVAG